MLARLRTMRTYHALRSCQIYFSPMFSVALQGFCAMLSEPVWSLETIYRREPPLSWRATNLGFTAILFDMNSEKQWSEEDKKEARKVANRAVRLKMLPRPCALPCVSCGHIYIKGERRHEYHHYLGYDAEHHLSVQAICTTCHAKTYGKALLTHCHRGHEFSELNTAHKPNGNRICLTCRRARDKKRGRDAFYWRQYRIKRAQKQLNKSDIYG